MIRAGGDDGTDLISAVRFIETHECIIYTGPKQGIDVYLRDERVVGSGKTLCSAVHSVREQLKAVQRPLLVHGVPVRADTLPDALIITVPPACP